MTRDLIFEIHRSVTDQTLENPAAAGWFRQADDDIAVVDPVLRSMILHFWLAHKAGKAWYFTPAPDFEARLAGL